MDELNTLRLQGVRLLAALSGLACFAVIVGAAFAGSGIVPVLLALALAVFPVLAAMRRAIDPLTRTVLGATMPLFCAVLLYQWSGGPWMIDLHMTFFAAIAVTAVLADWRAVIAGAAVTAVHHLALNLLAPALVFGATGDFARVLLHAVVVVVEAGALVQVTVMLEAVLINRAETAAAAAAIERAATLARERTAAEQDQVVTALAKGLRRLASGDLDCRIAATFPGAFDPLRVDFNRALVDLEQVVSQVLSASGQIQIGAGEIRTASQDLAERTEIQASTVESVMRTVGELVGVAGETLGRAQLTSSAIVQSAARVRTGHSVVASAIATMERIQKSSGEIGQIVSLIDGIAFQTNLLALNAGVEAARAGDSGRGFAVVANEVRALAQRSADAARDIKTLITASSAQVVEGVELVGQTGIVLRDVVDDVAGFTQAVDAITGAVGATARDLAGLRDTFVALDQTTQKNAAMVEQSHAALHALTGEASVLVEVANRFTTSASVTGVAQGNRRAMAA